MASTITVDKIKGGSGGVAFTLPTADGSAGQLLKTNGSAVLSWATDVDTGITAVVSDTTPQLGGMLDVNGNSIGDGTLELLNFTETASAVNEFTIANAATGAGPTLTSTGGDTNVDINITPKGTGSVVIDGLKYPQADGTANYVLKTDGSAQLSWVAQTTDTDTVYTHPNHSGDVVSTADGLTVIQVDAVDIPMLSATGTAGATTFLRGDNTWVVPTDTDTVYTHPNHSGDVTSTADGTTVIGASKVISSMILDDNVTADKLANTINTDIATGPAALPKAGGTMTGNITLGTNNVTFSNWTVTESSGVLYFATGGTNKMKLDASGNLICVGTISSNGTI